MSDIISADNGIIKRGRTEDGQFFVKTTFLDDSILKQNTQIKDSGNLHKSKFGMHDNEDVRATIRCPSIEQWDLFKKNNPEIAENLVSRHEYERLDAVKQISLLEPQWVLQIRL